MEDHTTFGRRLKSARNRKKMSQSVLAKHVGVSKQAVSFWETDTNFPDRDKLAIVAELLGVNLSWLLSGVEAENFGVEAGPIAINGGVPILTLEEALDQSSMDEVAERKRIQAFFPTGGNSFALIISDTSMEPEFLEGDAVIIDPDRTPTPGDKVCAQVTGSPRALFRLFKSPGHSTKNPKKFTLTALNKNWEDVTVNNDGQIIGVMSQHVRPARSKPM